MRGFLQIISLCSAFALASCSHPQEFQLDYENGTFDFKDEERDIIYIGQDPGYMATNYYRLFVYPDDRIAYERHNVDHQSILRQKQLEPGIFVEIMQILNSTPFFTEIPEGTFRDLSEVNYPSLEVCGRYAPDANMLSIATFVGGEKRGFRLEFGCREFPGEEKLLEAIQKIKSLLEVKKYQVHQDH